MDNANSPTWPSLYNPNIEIFHIPGRDPIQAGGKYLFQASDVFRFTLYWTLIFYTPFFVFCGIYAFLNLTFPPKPSNRLRGKGKASQHHYTSEDGHSSGHSDHDHEDEDDEDVAYTPPTGSPAYPLSPLPHSPSPTAPLVQNITPSLRLIHTESTPRRRPKPNAARSRLTFALLVFLLFITLSLLGALTSAAVVGFTLWGVFKAGKFVMSTWVPFLWALMNTFIGLLSVWPSVIDII